MGNLSLPILKDDGATAPSKAFLEFPGLLMLRLMSRCNNHCIFCMVEDEIRTSDDVEYADALGRIQAQAPGTRIEFFGGEPTIYPRFLELLRFAREHGFSCSIATHGRTFSSRSFTTKVAALDPRQIYIRTSLYGDTAELHDYYTAIRRSYVQTVQGIGNIVEAGFRCQVNCVIMKGNVERLSQMTQLVHSWGVPRIKFSNLICVGSCESEAVSLSTVRPHLVHAIELAENLGLTVTVEKTPVCVASGRLDLMSTERDLGRWTRSFDDQGECGRCLVRRWCEGLDPEYAERFGYRGLHALDRMSRRIIKGDTHERGEPEFLKVHCIEVPDGPLDDATLTALTGILESVEERFGRLAIFPRRFLDPIISEQGASPQL